MDKSPLTIHENPVGDLISFREADSQPEMSFLLIFGGSVECDVNNSHYFIAPNTLVILPEVSFIREMTSSDDFVGYKICVSNTLLEKLRWSNDKFIFWRKKNEVSVCKLDKQEVRIYKQYIRLLQFSFRDEKKPDALKEADYLLSKAFCFKIFEKYLHNSNAGGTKRDIRGNNTLVDHFIDLVKSVGTEHRNLSYYADKLCVTPKYLSHIVSKSTGKKATKWIEDYVIVQAMQMLKSTEMSITQISDALNYLSLSDFCRCFRKITGLTPRQFRAQK